MKPKRHHFVPKCYLKNFIVDRKLYALNIKDVQKGYTAQPELKSPGQICYFEDYYRITNELGDNQFKLQEFEDLFIETSVLRSLEGHYGCLYKKLTVLNRLSFEEAVSLSDFIIQLKLRNPYWREKTLEKNKNEWIDNIIEIIYQENFEITNRFPNIPDWIQKIIYSAVREASKADTNYSKKYS